MSLSEQQFQRNVWDTGKAAPLPGTAKHPQGRLMRPEYTGNPHAMSPENWLANDGHGTAPTSPHRGRTLKELDTVDAAGGKDILTWHTNTGDMHDYENEGRFEDRWGGERVKEDDKGRPHTEEMGYAIGTHFGTIQAGFERYPGPEKSQAISHPVKIATKTVLGDADGIRKYGDYMANHSANLTDKVEEGATVAYKNDVEDYGSTSYRTLRDTARTWNDDMDTAINKSSRFGIRGPAPQYRAAHAAGYSPAVETGKLYKQGVKDWDNTPTLPGMEGYSKDYGGFDTVSKPIFDGEQWTMRKKTGQ